MKFSILIIFLSFPILQAQEQLLYVEILTWAINFQNHETIKYTMENVGQVWCKAAGPYPAYPTNDYNYAEETFQANNTGSHYAFNQCWHNQGWEQFGFGLYRITIYDGTPPFGERTHFYLDFRYCNEQVDCTLLFDNTTGTAKIRTGVNVGGLNGFEEIPIGSIVNIWELYEYNSPLTTCLVNFWQYSLVIIPSQTGNHPKLVWGPHPTLTDVVGYRVYRKYGTATFDPIATTDFDEYYFNDTELTLEFQQGGTNAYYYVKAVVIHESESEATNTVVANIDGQSPEKQISSKNINYDFQINNYPNPFNPTTTIEYSTPERSNVVIKVYDMLGREVKVLINEIKDEGTYEVTFNAQSLSSGVYIYTITASNGSNSTLYRESKQMILMK